MLAELTAGGAHLTALNPLRETLEDVFVESVSTPDVLASRRGLEGTPGNAHEGHRRDRNNVFRESVRDKVLYNLVLFAMLLMAFVVLDRPVDRRAGRQDHQGLGLSATSSSGCSSRSSSAIGLVSKEVERRSIYALLAKPITRAQLVAGKFCGLVLTLAVNVGVMAVRALLVLALHVVGVAPEVRSVWDAPALDPAILKACS